MRIAIGIMFVIAYGSVLYLLYTAFRRKREGRR